MSGNEYVRNERVTGAEGVLPGRYMESFLRVFK